ncbi:tetratricopeptide repeat protein, partial [Alteromonas sp. 14N.309.X.WAT.G.H12]|uniref:tetratricopeptide repeat protein n=1 Tax=Alteromonas sp. 14N.309.X.WAT.G.H12 TaxID=3120824 RepID=UPI003A59981E
KKYSLDYFKASIDQKKYVLKDAALYGLALAYFRNENVAAAKKIIDHLLDKDPDNLFYLDAATDISIANEQYDEAIDRLAPHLAHTPRNQVLALNQANAMIYANRNKEAISILKDFLLVHPQYELAYQLLTEAYKNNKDFKGMHQSKAEVMALNGVYQLAVDELQFAYNFTQDNHLEKQRIRARIRQLREEEEKLKRL